MNIDINDTILIVTGSELTPELKDRPLAYRLKELIDKQGSNQYQQAIVVSDLWYMENEILQVCASIFIGGPGVNIATAQFFQKLPMYWTMNEVAFVQWLQDKVTKAAIWGMNQDGTDIALKYFETHLLNEFLELAW